MRYCNNYCKNRYTFGTRWDRRCGKPELIQDPDFQQKPDDRLCITEKYCKSCLQYQVAQQAALDIKAKLEENDSGFKRFYNIVNNPPHRHSGVISKKIDKFINIFVKDVIIVDGRIRTQGEIIMEKRFMTICNEISKKNDDLCWADHTVYPDGQADVAFTGPRTQDYTSIEEYDDEEEKFFNQMRQIESLIKAENDTYDVELIRFNADKLCPYAEATINFKINGGE